MIATFTANLAALLTGEAVYNSLATFTANLLALMRGEDPLYFTRENILLEMNYLNEWILISLLFS